MSIRPLPDGVVAQIKSAAVIVSLTGVVLELLKNSLDARASKIIVTVDFTRGGCTIEDDGLGISPAEFSEGGGLGKLYWTSKFQTDQPQLGQHGTFLASLSAVSLLTITSRHHAHRSHNSISFHHAQAMDRQTSISAQHYVSGTHGTRVTVRNLFGNMPVRVKQRTNVADQKAEQNRLLQHLKRETAGLLLSSQSSVTLKIRDSDNRTIVNFNTTLNAVDSVGVAYNGQRTPKHTSMLRIMTQADFIAIDQWESWVPASASTPTISVKGAISLEPAPNKHAQFISFGPLPLSSESRSNELYDHVNRLFALSDFGSVENGAEIDEQEKLRRLSDRRYKSDGYINRQLKTKKGVDRHPMFHFRVSSSNSGVSGMPESRSVEDESSLQLVIDVLSAVVTQWLSLHHFRPKKIYRVESTSVAGLPDALSRKRQVSRETPEKPVTANVNKRSRPVSLNHDLSSVRSSAFADWSRIKSGKASFFGTADNTRKTPPAETFQELLTRPSTNGSSSMFGSGETYSTAGLTVAPLFKYALGGATTKTFLKAENNTASAPHHEDGTMIWMDPSTKTKYLLNARTGCVNPHQRLQTSPAALSPSFARLNTPQASRSVSPSTSIEPTKTPWLDGLLQGWRNPVFKPTEQEIRQSSLQQVSIETEIKHTRGGHVRCSSFSVHKIFDNVGLSSARLSKDALYKAEVISQVDKKFILTRLDTSPTDCNAHDILVLVDQHAADERIRVETLLNDLCSPIHSHAQSGYRSSLGFSSPVDFVILEKPLQFTISTQEHTHFETFAPHFAAWGILYDTNRSPPELGKPVTTEAGCRIMVTTLPSAISERCKAGPQLLISFLRSAVWQYVDSPPLLPVDTSYQHTSWVKRIATCPSGLVDLVNSRACRSAIMFNDELSLVDCKALITRLAGCVFPFICAHGRPSMVPIVDLTEDMIMDSAFEHADTQERSSFVDAWKRWKQ